MKYIAGLDKLNNEQHKLQQQKSISFLSRCRYGSCTQPSRKRIVNLSSHTLNDEEGFVLAHALNHSVPPSTANQEEFFCSFESMTLYLTQLVPSSKTKRYHTIASLTELAHSFANTPVEVGDKNTLIIGTNRR